MNTLKTLVVVIGLASMLIVGGCSYGGVATSGDNVVITRNDGFLFGILRKVYVCKVTDAGVTDCSTADKP